MDNFSEIMYVSFEFCCNFVFMFNFSNVKYK